MLKSLAHWVTGAADDNPDVPVALKEEKDNKGLIDLQCGRTVFNDVPARMRTELWLSQLFSGPAAAAVACYPTLAAANLNPEVLSEIEKDCHRTFPGHHLLSKPAGQRAMLRVLRAYASFDPEVGYTQGMGFLAGCMLTYLSEAQAFGGLTLVMRERGLRDIYLPDNGMAILQVRLWQLGRLIPPKLAAHLEGLGALPVLYASSWFLTCFAADFPMHFAARVMDLVVTDAVVTTPLMKVAVAVLERCEEALLAVHDLEEVVDLLRKRVPAWPKARLQDLLTEALCRGWAPWQADVLREMNGAETVAEAVARVNANAAAVAAAASISAEEPTDARSPKSSSAARTRSIPAEELSLPLPSPPPSSSFQQPPLPATPLSAVRLAPFPLPPTHRQDQVKWGTPPSAPAGAARPPMWRPDTPMLAAVTPNKLRIDSELHETVLDPALSRHLSTYLTSHGRPNAHAQAAAALQEEAQSVMAEAAAAIPIGLPGGAGPETPVSSGGSVGIPQAPSPFASALTSEAAGSAPSAFTHGSKDTFSEFTGATEPGGGVAGSVDARGSPQMTIGACSVTHQFEELTFDSSGGAAAPPLPHRQLGTIHEPSPAPVRSDMPEGLPLDAIRVTGDSWGSWREARSGVSDAGKIAQLPTPSSQGSAAFTPSISAASSRAMLLQQEHAHQFFETATSPPKMDEKTAERRAKAGLS